MLSEVNATSVRVMIRAGVNGGFVAAVNRPFTSGLPERGIWNSTDRDPSPIPTDAVLERLGEVIFNDEVGDALLNVRRSGEYHRIVLNLPAETAVASLPWEAALPPKVDHWEGIDPIGLWEKTSVVRRNSAYPHINAAALFDTPPSTAYVLDARQVDPDDSLVSAKSPLDISTIPFAFSRAPWNRDQQFNGDWFNNCDVLHFVGHATADHLVLDGVDANWEEVIKPALSRHAPRFVFLEACSTAGAKGADRIALAWLISEKVPAVIGMLSQILANAANVFAETFYGAVANGSPVDFAVQRARRATKEAGHADWMLPVLYLSTPGAANVPRPRTLTAQVVEPTSAHEPLAVIAVAGKTAEIRWDGSAFRTQTSSHRGPAEEAPNVRLAPGGDVGVAADVLGLHVWTGAARSTDMPDFPPQGAESSGSNVVLASQLLPGGELEVAVARPAGILLWQRRAGRWRAPRSALEGTPIVSGVLLSDGFLGVTADGRVVSSGVALGLPDAAAQLATVAGVDAMSVGGADLLALWGQGLKDEPGIAVFTRGRARANGWRLVDINGDLPADTVRVGFRREYTAGRTRPGTEPVPINLVVQSTTGGLSLHSFTVMVRK